MTFRPVRTPLLQRLRQRRAAQLLDEQPEDGVALVGVDAEGAGLEVEACGCRLQQGLVGQRPDRGHVCICQIVQP
jgi:hypothetical protein